MKIYTCTGDKGDTSLVGGTRVPKSHIRLEAYGTIDEVNAHLGLLLTYPLQEADKKLLETVQSTLFTVGALLATQEGGDYLETSCIKQLEDRIDAITAVLPLLRAFVLPAGTPAACQAHVARTVVRRAERHMVALSQVANVKPITLMYVNRLSDYLFVLARHLTINAHLDEKKWEK